MYQVVPEPGACAAAITIEVATDCVCAGLPLSVTVAVKLKTPLTVGVPEIIPVVAAKVSPDGMLPEVIDHV
jgi:hypothetical protein